MTNPPPPDPREAAFEALLPLAMPTSLALSRVEDLLRDEQRLVAPLHEEFLVSQRAGLAGYLRFCLAIREWGRVLSRTGRVARVSSEIQESQNIFLWLLDQRYVLRVKHDLTEVVDPGTVTLFALESVAEPVVVYLTWTVRDDGSIADPAFATVDEPKWTIRLDELLRETEREHPRLSPRRRPVIKSKRQARRAEGDGLESQDQS